jgi:hypothetical protein
MHRVIFVLVAAAAFGAVQRPAPRHEIDNVAAFARLYGVVRYFHPGDGAASLDWDRFAVHGVSQVRTAVGARALETALEALFTPLGRGIEIGSTLPPSPVQGEADTSLVAWRYLGPGIAPSIGFSPYLGKRTNRSLVTAIDGFVTVMQTVPALPLRGRTVRLRGRVRATVKDPAGSASLWLRVDRTDSKMGFFDNMGDRPVRETAWREYSLEGPVADDATSVAFGVMASGAVTADFDAIDLAVRDGNGAWTTVPIEDAGFEADKWVRAGTSKSAAVTRVADSAPEGRQFLRFAPQPAPPSHMELFEESAPVSGAYVDVDLDAGLKARVTLALSGESATGSGSATPLNALRSALRQPVGPSNRRRIETRLADVVLAWNVFRHFYPYWNESGVTWDDRLRPQLEVAYAAGTRQAQRSALQELVADARDGHGTVTDLMQAVPRALLPVRLAIIEDSLVVTASDRPKDVSSGSIIRTIDGSPAMSRVHEAMRLASGTNQWKQTRALNEVSTCETGALVNLSVDSGAGSRPVTLRCEGRSAPAERRPAAIAELTQGLWYVDLTRASMAQVTPQLETLARADGVVFDLRGYPTDSGGQILAHLIDAPESDRWMHVAKIVGPFGRSAGRQSLGWNLSPRTPRLEGRIVFLTDGRAISYAESVLGYVKDRKLATILGSTTAGANGNVVRFTVPGGFAVTFTGMRVTRHDGRTPHHLRGVEPDVPVRPTLAGVRGGRDEVLDRAVALIQGK